MLKKIILIVVFGVLIIPTNIIGQSENAPKEKNFQISPIAAPGYTPELGFLLAVGGLMSFSTDISNPELLRTSFPFTIAYTTTKAIVANGILTSYWLDDKLRINGDFWYKDMPDHYWGVGYDKIESTPKSDSTTAYHRKWWWFNPRFLYQFMDSYFIGLNVDYTYTKGSEASVGVANDPVYQKFNDKPFSSGLGLIIRHDSRDIPVDARRGVYVDLRATFYSESFGGDNNYNIYLLDYRQFQTINRPGQTIGWQVKARIGDGEVPYGEMSQLGTPFDLRGYTWGRLRDKNMLFTIVEYRHTFLKGDGSLSKHGAVVWVGSGTIFENRLLEENNLTWVPNFGVGYRFELQPRMNLRLDFGIGKNTSGIYFNFNQAF
ncbi:MAG: BamA/TamA family outer membrane protein [Bacteroidota bacterium]